MNVNIVINNKDFSWTDGLKPLIASDVTDIEDLYNHILLVLNKLSAIKYNSSSNSMSLDFRQILVGLLLMDNANIKFGTVHNPTYNIYILFEDSNVSDKKVQININYFNGDQWESYKQKTYYVDFPMSNCVDKFTILHAKRLGDKISEHVSCLYDDRMNRNKEIQMNNNAYHNTSQYEKDFSNLIEIKNAAKELYERTSKFLENLTDSKYTE